MSFRSRQLQFFGCWAMVLCWGTLLGNPARATPVSPALCFSRAVLGALKAAKIIPHPKKKIEEWHEGRFLEDLRIRNYDEYERVTEQLSDAQFKIYLRKAKAKFETDGGHDWHPRNFSNPSQHDPKKFRYIVHGVWDDTRPKKLGQTTIPGTLYFSSDPIDLLEHPEKLSSIPRISASVVSEQATQTYTKVGVILEVPEPNILSVYFEDAGTPYRFTIDEEKPGISWKTDDEYVQAHVDKVKSDRNEFPTALMSPLEVLKKTKKHDVNELVIFNHTDEGQTRVSGYFVVVDKAGKAMIGDAQFERVRRLAEENHLPVVLIPSP